jgi:hypothetical protein
MLTVAASAAGAVFFTIPLTTSLLILGPSTIRAGLVINGLAAGSGRSDSTGALFIIGGIGMCVAGACALPAHYVATRRALAAISS